MVKQKIFGGAEQQASKLFFTRLMELIFVGSKLLLQLKKKDLSSFAKIFMRSYSISWLKAT